MSEEWMIVKEASQALGITERTLRRRISVGSVESKLEEGRRLVRVIPDEFGSEVGSEVGSEGELVLQLRAENEYLKRQIQELQDARQRSDTIALQLTRQVEQSQRLLEYHAEPWYRRWFRRNG